MSIASDNANIDSNTAAHNLYTQRNIIKLDKRPINSHATFMTNREQRNFPLWHKTAECK
jgi:hypothetical protein